jgi:hypothetical protein
VSGGEDTAGAVVGHDVTLRLVNEFAEVEVRKVDTRNGARLEIAAPRLGTVVRLCPLELEALTRIGPEAFSNLLGSPDITGGTS